VLSIVKRSAALGLLAHSDTEERWTRSRREIESLIRIAMGGIVAEEIFFGDTSSGVAGDLQAATEAAAQMVGSFGMAGSLVSLDAVHGTGAANIVAKVMSDEASRVKLDGILDSARADVHELLGDYRYLVEALRDALLEREELIGVEIEDVLRAAADVHTRTLVPGGESGDGWAGYGAGELDRLGFEGLGFEGPGLEGSEVDEPEVIDLRDSAAEPARVALTPTRAAAGVVPPAPSPWWWDASQAAPS
jgi:hypothetical protein